MCWHRQSFRGFRCQSIDVAHSALQREEFGDQADDPRGFRGRRLLDDGGGRNELCSLRIGLWNRTLEVVDLRFQSLASAVEKS